MEKLKQAVQRAQEQGMAFDAIAYKYNISPPTLRKAVNGDSITMPRIVAAINKIVEDYNEV